MKIENEIPSPLTQGQINYRKRKAREQKKREEQENIDRERALMNFSTPLKEILLAEIEAGNPMSSWNYDYPEKGSLLIFVTLPFKTPIIRNSNLFTFENINDPHYWKAWYLDEKNNCYLGCPFDGPDFTPL